MFSEQDLSAEKRASEKRTRKALKIGIGGLLTLSLGLSLHAQKATNWTDYRHPVKFERISVESGLSQSSVLDILQDGRGFMWFGTEDGLNRYDGYNFAILRNVPQNPNSLSENLVNALYEDRSGVLWIGTTGGGLNKFDREKEQFIRYKHDPADPGSLSHNAVSVIFEDRRGDLWIGTDGGGLNRVRPPPQLDAPLTFVHHRADPARADSLSGNFVTSIYEDHGGVLWVGTEDGGLSRVIPGQGEDSKPSFFRYHPNRTNPEQSPPEKVTSIGEDHRGNLWIGSPNGLYRFDSGRERFTRFLSDPGRRGGLSHNYIRVIYKDKAGVLWIGTDGGGLDKLLPGRDDDSPPVFVAYKNDLKDPESLSGDAVEAIYEDRSGVLWVGVYYGGLNKLVMGKTTGFDREKRPFVYYHSNPFDPASLSHNAVNAIFEDRRGDLWIGTDGGGLNRVSPPAQLDAPLTFVHHRADPKETSGLNDNVITSICEDRRGTLWIGTYTGGLNRLVPDDSNLSRPVFQHYRNDPDDPSSLSSDFIMTIFEDSFQTLWIGTVDGGLNRLDRETGAFTRYQLDPNDPGSPNETSVYVIREDRSHALWIGTLAGLYLFDRDKGPLAHYGNDVNDPDSLSHNYVRVIHEDRSGILWIGTEGGGLNKLIPGPDRKARPKFKRFTMKEGLPNDVISGILEDDDGNLWLSTNNGISRFDPQHETFKNYDQKDGLQSNEFHRGAYFQSRSGEMFFGGSNGFNVFDPDDIIENSSLPPVVILDFQVFNRSVPIGKYEDGHLVLQKSITETKDITLSYRDYVFSFQYAALHYVSPEKNKYAYMLKGLEKDWNYVGNRRFVTYTTLPAGNYTFKVKASNSDGVWNEDGLEVNIKITPPFWKTGWFYMLAVLTVLASGAGFFQWRVRQLKKRKTELEQTVKERTEQLENVNLRLADANVQLEQLATTDELTRIANIRHFNDFFSREWRRAVRYPIPLSLILIDVDYFKSYNDTYGHQAGDECLRRIAQTIREFARRPGDLAARYGGEEFIILLSGADRPGAASVAEKIRVAVEALKIDHEKSKAADCMTISLGSATIIPGSKTSPNALIKRADEALYLSKKNGRNRCTVADMT